MKIQFTHKTKSYSVDLARPLDISMEFTADPSAAKAWYQPPLEITPVRMGDWVGEVRQGAAVNFRNIFFNPHAHGTHTESPGHITPGIESVNRYFRDFFCMARVISIHPEKRGADDVITLGQFQSAGEMEQAVVLRTLPNNPDKRNRQYSDTNPPYLEAAAAEWLRDQGVKHLLIDLPSVDKEKDDGLLLAHHAFWNVPEAPRLDCTITEFVFVPDQVADGLYLLNMQVAPFDNDAAPSRPLLFQLY